MEEQGLRKTTPTIPVCYHIYHYICFNFTDVYFFVEEFPRTVAAVAAHKSREKQQERLLIELSIDAARSFVRPHIRATF